METNSTAPGSKHGILSISIKDLAVLYSAYMPFVENGGLFIPSRKHYDIGDEVFIENTGAYTTTYASVAFNGFEPLRSYVI